MSVSRDNARRITRLAQVGAAALAVGAVTVAWVNADRLTEVPDPGPDAGPSLPPAPQTPDGPPPAPELDLPLLVGVLWEYGNPPSEDTSIAAAEPPTTAGNGSPTKPTVTTPPTANATPGWRYIGQIVGPRTTHALLERQGLQRLVAAGGEAEGTRVLEVHRDHVMLDDGSGPQRVDLAAAANAWEQAGIAAPSRPDPAANITTPPGHARPGRPGAQPPRPPTVAPGRPAQSPDEMEEMRQKMEELRRQREESGEMGALDAPGAGPTRRLAHAGTHGGGNAG